MKVPSRQVIGIAAVATLAVCVPSAAAGANRPVPHGQATTTGAAASREQSVGVMTYNILELTNDGRHEGNGRVAPWAKRGPKEAALVNQARPDVIAIEEGAAWVGRPRGARQVDSLRRSIGGSYRLAHTEISPNRPHYFRTGVYIIYNSATFKKVRKGAHFALGQNRFAAYQEFANRATGAKFLFVATHLLVGYGRSDDLAREAETKKLLSKGGAIAHKRGVPVIYAGDFNSASTKDRKFTLDGAGIAMRQAGAKDALHAAHHKTHARYNSANGYFRKPPRSGDSIDHIFAPRGIQVESAGIVLDLRHGRFVGVIPSDHNPLVARLRYPY